jgi:hypothetical protein
VNTGTEGHNPADSDESLSKCPLRPEVARLSIYPGAVRKKTSGGKLAAQLEKYARAGSKRYPRDSGHELARLVRKMSPQDPDDSMNGDDHEAPEIDEEN